ncbi:gamma-glutamyltransferase [Streptomyces alboflavus]|uniref:Gamma-glutamyltransferase n=1 Tax=Streptomyces alboflavus TaxID=67267 RepID=A0A1Z1WM43_9ACTN|nr:gamma-glutamyltransferase [Streptomyces alboflavus]
MFTTRPTLQGTFGMVSSTHWLASQSAMAVLEDGGNAYDAAVAAGFVLHVVEPHLNGPAGEVPIILATAGGDVRVLCGQGVAPAGASVAHYRDALGLDLVPGTGPLAAAVPGAFDAWMLLLRDHGTKPLAEVLKYAIGYAEDGHPPVERVTETIETVRDLFETEWTSSAEVYLPGGTPPAPGELLRNPRLAATWRRLIAEAEAAGGADRDAQIDAAREVWRTGFIAEALVRQSARPTLDTSGKRHTGTLTAADLADWSATYEDPVSHDWNGWTLCKAGPWSQGPAFLQQLALLPDELPAYGSADYTHLLVEGCKLAMADREAWYGDAAEVPVAELLSYTYNARRRELIGERASHELRPGRPGGREPRLSAHARAVASGRRGPCARVRWGPVSRPSREAVSRSWRRTAGPGATPAIWTSSTAGGTWSRRRRPAAGSSPTRRAGTRLPARHPAADDLAGGGPAQLAHPRPPPPHDPDTVARPQGRRARHRLRHAGRGPAGPVAGALLPVGGTACAGARRLRPAGRRRRPQLAHRVLPESFYPRGMRPGSLVVESRTDPQVVAELRRRGHDVTVGGPWSEGRLCAVARDPRTGVLSAAANPRGMQGYAVGR